MRKNRHVIVFVSILASLCILFPAAGLESSNPDVASQKSVVHDSGNNSRPMEYFNVSHEVKDNLFRTIRLPCGETYQYPYTTIHEEKLEYQDIRVEKTVTQKSNLTQHEPIWIDGDNNFTSENGVTNGTGTITDPYIIEGWKIERRVDIPHIMPWCAGIVIKNTIKYVVVKDIHIINPLYKRYMMYAGGITLSNVSNCKLQNIIIETDGEPLTWLDMPDDHGVEIRGQSNNISIENTTIIGHGESISIYKSCNVTLRNNTLNNTLQPFNIYGNQTKHYIFDVDSSNTANDKTVKYLIGEENLFFDNSSKIGFLGLVSCANVTVKNFTYSGILLANVTNGTIIDSDIRFVIISLSSNISVINTTVHGDGYCGFHFSLNKNTVLLNSTIYNTTCGIIAGSLHSSLSPGFSLIKNLTIYSCYIGVSLCGSNHRIEDSIINATSVKPGYSPVGIWIGWSAKNNTIDNTTIIGGGAGILLCDTSGNIITNCTIKGFGEDGVFFGSDACNNTIVNCNITGWWFGISMLGGANNNTITKNTFYNNTCYGYAYGIEISYEDWTGTFWGYSNNNLIYHNNFIGNDHNVYDDCANFWDYDGIGNYWDDYLGYDNNNDGIGDNPYSIPGGKNVDNYPLIEPVGVDTIKPKITITGVENNTYYNHSVTPMITIFDLNLNTSVVTLNGEDFISGTMISEDGTYVLFVQATDKMNNKAEQTVTFTIDKTPPTISLVSPDNNSVIKPGEVIDFEITDVNLWNASYCVNNGVVQYFSSFYDISTEGWKNETYNITVYAKDRGMNEITKTFSFIVDGIQPDISLISPENNTVIKRGTIIDFEINDIHLNLTTYTVNDEAAQPFSSPYNISTKDWEDGTYDIKIFVNDLAGNEISKTFRFIIDGTPPTINIVGVMNGNYYNTNVTPIISISDAHLNISENIITLDNLSFVSGTEVNAEGKHTLYVYAADKAGNNVSQTIIFTVDKTKPSVTISGIEDGAYYNTDIAPVIDITDANLNMSSITLNGNPFTSDTTVSAENTYTLVVQAVDKAGNTAEKTITFTIDKTEPGISELTPATGTKTTKSSIVVSGKTEPDAVVKINGIGVSVDSDGSFSKEIMLVKGENSIVITATDLAGNTKTETITITMEEKKEKSFIPGFEIIYLLAGICVSTVLFKKIKK